MSRRARRSQTSQSRLWRLSNSHTTGCSTSRPAPQCCRCQCWSAHKRSCSTTRYNWHCLLGAAAIWYLLSCPCAEPAVRCIAMRALSVGSSPHALRVLQGSGSSVMEMSHRGKEFTSIINKAEADLRQLLSIPDNYEVRTLSWCTPADCRAADGFGCAHSSFLGM